MKERGGKEERERKGLNARDQNIVCEALAFLSRSQWGVIEREELVLEPRSL
jgi:hypothetical protein